MKETDMGHRRAPRSTAPSAWTAARSAATRPVPLGAALAVALAAAVAVPAAPAVADDAPPAAPVKATTADAAYSAYPPILDPGSGAADYFTPSWLDDGGNHIQAHGGQVVSVSAEDLGVDAGSVVQGEEAGETVYYWYGEDRSNGYYGSPGVHAYKSYDTRNWTDEGIVLRSVSDAAELESDYFDALYDTVDDAGEPRADRIAELDYHLNTNDAADHTTIFERPKVLYNEATKQWVLWWHSDGQTTPGGSMYARSMAGVAVSDSPTGPFKMTGVYRMPNRTNYQACISAAVPGQARDMTVFQDDDGTAYIVYSSEENRTLYIAELDADYTNVTHTTDVDMVDAGQYSEDGRYPYLFADGTTGAPVRGEDFQIVKECGVLEAPALFQHGGKYYTVASGATGWAPNPQTYYTADSILGSWIRGVEAGDQHENVAYNAIPEGGDGLLSVGDTRRTTFGSQSTNVLDLGGGRFVYMGDRWNAGAANSNYVWLPVTIGESGRAEMRNPATEDPARWADGWDESYWDDKGTGTEIWRVTDDGVPDQVAPGEDFGAALPDAVPVEVGGVTSDVAVTWSATSFETRGTQTLTGTLAAGDGFTAGRTFTRTVEVHEDGVANLAPGASVAASSRANLAPTVVDGNVKGKGWDDWTSSGYPRNSWLSFTWPLTQDLTEVVVHTYKDGAGATWPSTVAAEYLDASGAWTTTDVRVDLAQDAASAAPVATLDVSDLPRTNALRVRLTTATNTWQSISEVQVWGADDVVDLCRAEGTTVSASFHQTEWETMPAANACDGNASTSWSTWSGSAGRDEVTFTVEPAEARAVDRVGFTTTEGTIATVGVEYRDAQGTWHPTTAQDVAPAATGAPTSVEFEPVWASAVRLTFATPGSYVKIPTLGVGARSAAVVPEVAARCVGRDKAQLVTTVRNLGDRRADIEIRTPFGTRVVRDVAPGRTGQAVVSTRGSALEAGSVTVGKRGEAGLTAGYPAANCG
ncbi:glycoside hydrolase family 43 protein [Promicromonospora sukumoe]|uniref:glycoside hydrolase family 43 protein n=1 Tax=Promicromonospora sukumoe TaxID=88382 RepID=UPI0012FA7B41|nr:glycoside hydrolase family 43 protein [Promicromonospora sukumoe]